MRVLNRLKAVLPVDEYHRRATLDGVEKETLEQRLEESLLETLIGARCLAALRVSDRRRQLLGREAPSAGRSAREADVRLRATARSSARAIRVRTWPKPHHRQVALRVGRSIFALRTNATIDSPAAAAVHGMSVVLVRVAGAAVADVGRMPVLRERRARTYLVRDADRLRAGYQREARSRSGTVDCVRRHDRARATRGPGSCAEVGPSCLKVA